MSITSAVIFRNDLRLQDNPALYAANTQSNYILPVYILDAVQDIIDRTASGQYLLQSLKKLDEKLRNNGSQLILLRNEQELVELLQEYNVRNVYWNADSDPKIQLTFSQRYQRLAKMVSDYM